MLQSNGKVQRKKVRPASKSSKQRTSSSVAPISRGSHEGTSSGDGDFPSALPQEVEQIFEVS